MSFQDKYKYPAGWAYYGFSRKICNSCLKEVVDAGGTWPEEVRYPLYIFVCGFCYNRIEAEKREVENTMDYFEKAEAPSWEDIEKFAIFDPIVSATLQVYKSYGREYILRQMVQYLVQDRANRIKKAVQEDLSRTPTVFHIQDQE